MSEPGPLRDLLKELGKRWGMDNPIETARAFSHWERIVGAEVAARCKPLSIQAGVLKVGTESAAWASELRYLAPAVARRVNDDVGTELVREMVVLVRPPNAGSEHLGDGRGRRRLRR